MVRGLEEVDPPFKTFERFNSDHLGQLATVLFPTDCGVFLFHVYDDYK